MEMRHSLLLIIVSTFVFGCDSDDGPRTIDSYQYSSDSFYPMTVGNYWRLNDDNYTEIITSTMINGELYYQFFSRIGGDVISTEYLRIDSDNNLISAYPGYDHQFVQAKFNAPVDDSFFTVGDGSPFDQKVTILEKTDDLITFEFDSIYAPGNSKFNKVYKRGFGLVGQFTEAKIGGVIYKFDSKPVNPFTGP